MIEYFRNVNHFLRFLLSMQAARDVHDAACISDYQRGRLAFLQIAYFSLEKFCREFGMRHGEDPAKAAAVLFFGQFYDGGTLHLSQQRTRLVVDAQSAREMAGWMVGQCAVPVCACVNDIQNIHQILGEFECPFCQCLRAGQPVWVVREEFRIIVADHMRARAGGGEHISGQAFEHVDHVLGYLARIRTEAGVELRLSAAGLGSGEVHVHTQALENADDGLSSFGVERIDQAGCEEL